jgi:hypothetical protein
LKREFNCRQHALGQFRAILAQRSGSHEWLRRTSGAEAQRIKATLDVAAKAATYNTDSSNLQCSRRRAIRRELQYAATYDTVADLQCSRDLQYNRRFTSVPGVESAQ